MDSAIIEADYDYGYPVGKIDDIYIHFLHYESFEQAVKKWEIRKKELIGKIYLL